MNTPSTTDKDYYLSKPATVSEAKSQLVLANRVLANENIFDHLGHVSVRSPENEQIFLISRSRSPEQVTLDDMLEVDLTGKVLTQTTERPYSERVIHAAIYTARPDVNCIVHTHPMYATAFSSTGQRLMPINNESVLFAKPLPYFDRVTDLIVTPELGKDLAETLGHEKAVFMKNHGIVVVGESIEEATVRTYLLEKAVKTLFVAKVLGDPGWTDADRAIRGYMKMPSGIC
jgi:L-ribulose-5-phosphate 4-epimerase